MIQGVTDPVSLALSAGTGVSGWLVVGWMVRMMFTGKVRTEAELLAMQKRAESAEAALRVRDVQVSAALEVFPKIAGVLQKIHLAGEQASQQRADERSET